MGVIATIDFASSPTVYIYDLGGKHFLIRVRLLENEFKFLIAIGPELELRNLDWSRIRIRNECKYIAMRAQPAAKC